MSGKVNSGTLSRFHELLPLVKTTFTLPTAITDSEDIMTSGNETGLVDLYLPFDCFEIREPFKVEGSVKDPRTLEGVSSVVIHEIKDNDGRSMIEIAYELAFSKPGIKYTYYPDPSNFVKNREETNHGVLILMQLLLLLDKKGTRYIQEQVSRQVRRHGGRHSDWKSFIVIPKTSYDKSLYERGESLSRIGIRLHSVRGHLRHLSDGRLIFVRPHTRGSIGGAVQVKDYTFKSEETVEK